MEDTAQLFSRLAREEFGFLESEFGFVASTVLNDGDCTVEYDAPRIKVAPYWNYRLENDVALVAKVDTFWIRPASTHWFGLFELLRMAAPNDLKAVPSVDLAQPSPTALQSLLSYQATMLRRHGEPLLRGDLSLCEDMLITNYCEQAKSIPWDEYLAVFRAETSSLPWEERQKLETAFETRSPRTAYFALEQIVGPNRRFSDRLLATLDNFRNQHFH